jgi:hypothetical protein
MLKASKVFVAGELILDGFPPRIYVPFTVKILLLGCQRLKSEIFLPTFLFPGRGSKEL